MFKRLFKSNQTRPLSYKKLKKESDLLIRDIEVPPPWNDIVSKQVGMPALDYWLITHFDVVIKEISKESSWSLQKKRIMHQNAIDIGFQHFFVSLTECKNETIRMFLINDMEIGGVNKDDLTKKRILLPLLYVYAICNSLVLQPLTWKYFEYGSSEEDLAQYTILLDDYHDSLFRFASVAAHLAVEPNGKSKKLAGIQANQIFPMTKKYWNFINSIMNQISENEFNYETALKDLMSIDIAADKLAKML